MENKLKTQINIEGVTIKHFNSIQINQYYNDHHYFEFSFNAAELGKPTLISLKASRDYIGKNISISFGFESAGKQEFIGLITHVDISQKHGYHGIIILSGYSPTILLERGKKLAAYADKSLMEVIDSATSGIAQNDLNVYAQTQNNNPINFLIQFKESDWQFLNRLSAEYYESLHYDGTKLVFGIQNNQKEVDLFYGRDVHQLDYGIQTKSIKHNLFSYLSTRDEILLNSETNHQINHPNIQKALERSNLLYNKTYPQQGFVNFKDVNELNHFAKLEERNSIANLLKVKGRCDNPELGIGTMAIISMSIREGKGFLKECLGKFLITEIRHFIDGTGKYFNEFQGIDSNVTYLSVENCIKPEVEFQLAEIVENEDPEYQGRVKVKFKWETNQNDTSNWLRVLTSHAGTGERGKNRGFLAIPEIGDQVLIGFENGNVAFPIVMGSLYHKNNIDTAKFNQNSLKTISTKSGLLIEFNDDENSQGIQITDLKGNVIHIDTSNNTISLNALENMNFSCKNMQIKVEENMGIQVGGNQEVDIGNDQKTTVANQYFLQAKMADELIEEDKNVDIKGDFKTNTATSTICAMHGDLMLKSEGVATLVGAAGAKINKS